MKVGKPINGQSYPLTRHGFICAVSSKESSSDLSQPLTTERNINAASIKNSLGYVGLFQFGEAALIDLGYYKHWDDNTDKTKANDWTGSWTGKRDITALSQFLNSASLQIQIIGEWIDLLCQRLRNRNFNEYYGKTINGVEITESGAIAGAHLVGEGGLGSFLGVPNFAGQYKESDGNDVHISKYIEMFNYYDLESCCNRKISISLKNQIGQPVKNKTVTIESEYNGKFSQPKFVTTAESDDEGRLPVITRHPGSKIVVKVDGKQSKEIVQEADKKQNLELNVNDDIKVQGVLDTPAAPQKKEQEKVTVEQKSNPSSQAVTPTTTSNVVNFSIAILEGDTRKKITNMKFFLKYKGETKQYISDGTGVKTGLSAEAGETIDVLVSGSKSYQKIKTISVNQSIQDTCVTVLLNTVSVKLKISDQNNNAVKNNVFYINYRGREIEKTTDGDGCIQLKMLNAFVYKLLLKNKKEVLTLRNDQSISLVNVTLNAETAKLQADLSKPKSTSTQEKTDSAKDQDKSSANHSIDFVPDIGEKKDTHTEQNGNPLTKVYGTEVAFTIKTINKATQKEEDLPYTINYKGAKRSHYSGQDGTGLKKHRGEEGQKIEISVDVNGQEQLLYSAVLKQPMPIIELNIDKPKDDENYLYPLKTAEKVDSYKKGYGYFGSRRAGGQRKHAGCDLYAPLGTEVRAMADGVVRNVYYFYSNTDAIEIVHAKHIIRYGEVLKGKSLVKAGDHVKRGQVIGYIGNLKGISNKMLHLEMYSNPSDKGTLSGGGEYKRRKDLIDPTPFLDRSVL